MGSAIDRAFESMRKVDSAMEKYGMDEEVMIGSDRNIVRNTDGPDFRQADLN